MEVERLSLENFEPQRAHAPYLNSPRSLEACRRHGVQPVELVEVPIDEFRKSFPNDPDIANRRYARIDGARQRILNNVLLEWQHLRDTNWKPETKICRVPQAEQIIPVPPEIHCELLEIQASQFRKLEQKQMMMFKRMLKIELKSAVEAVQHRRIIERHEEIQAALDNTQRERNMAREILHKEKVEEQRRLDAERARLMRLDKLAAQEESLREHEQQRINEQREKQNRIARDMAILQNAEYIKSRRDFIMKQIDTSFEQKQLVKDMRDKEQNERVQLINDNKQRQQQLKKEELEQRLNKAKQDKLKSENDKREELLKKVDEAEEKRERIRKELKTKFEQSLGSSLHESKEKMMQIRQTSDEKLQEKTMKVMSDIQFKEYLAAKELAKVKDQQEKRKTIKAIREEAFQLAKLRKQKIDEFQRNKAEEDLRLKQERTEAIKKGQEALKQMRFDIKNVMFQTRLELKRELSRLQHKDEYNPDRVFEKAQEVTEHILLPSLEKKFSSESESVDDINQSSYSNPLFQLTDSNSLDGTNNNNNSNSNSLYQQQQQLQANRQSSPFLAAVLSGDMNTMSNSNLIHSSSNNSLSGGNMNNNNNSNSPIASNGIGNKFLLSKSMNSFDNGKSGGFVSKSSQSPPRSSAGGRSRGSSAHGGQQQHRAKTANPMTLRGLRKDELIHSLEASKVFGIVPPEHHLDGKRGSRSRSPEHHQSRSLLAASGGSNGSPGQQHRATSSSSSGKQPRKPKPQQQQYHHHQQQQQQFGGENYGITGGNDEEAGSVSDIFPLYNYSLMDQDGDNVLYDDPNQRNSRSRSRKANKSHKLEPINNGTTTTTATSPATAPAPTTTATTTTAAAAAAATTTGATASSSVISGRSGSDLQQASNGSMTSSRIGTARGGGGGGADGGSLGSSVPISMRPPGPGEYRREYSDDHPYAGGSGKYKKEKAKGHKLAGSTARVQPSDDDRIERLSYAAQAVIVDPEKQLERLRKDQNEFLLQVLAKEKAAEEARESALRQLDIDMQTALNPEEVAREKQRLEVLFVDERKRASEKIISLTKEHEAKIRDAVVHMMDIKGKQHIR